MPLPNQRPIVFGYFFSTPQPYNFNGQPGWFTVPAGHLWASMTDSNHQQWVSPNPLTRNEDGTISGNPIYAAELTYDGTLVFQDQLASSKLGLTSPEPSQFPIAS